MNTIAINHIEIVDSQPRILGKRITVQEIVAMHILNQQPISWIVENYDLTAAEVHTALAYYYDNQAEITQALHESEVFAKQNATSLHEEIARLKAR